MKRKKIKNSDIWLVLYEILLVYWIIKIIKSFFIFTEYQNFSYYNNLAIFSDFFILILFLICIVFIFSNNKYTVMMNKITLWVVIIASLLSRLYLSLTLGPIVMLNRIVDFVLYVIFLAYWYDLIK